MRTPLLLLAAGACAHPGESQLTPEPDPTPAAADTSEGTLIDQARALDDRVAEAREALAALELFEVGELVGGNADQAFSCYGECPDAAEQVAAYEARTEALEELVTRAEQTAAEAEDCAIEEVEEHLDMLRGLQIVEVGRFVSEQAEPSPYCYNLPCPEDEQAAHEQNCARSARIAELASEW